MSFAEFVFRLGSMPLLRNYYLKASRIVEKLFCGRPTFVNPQFCDATLRCWSIPRGQNEGFFIKYRKKVWISNSASKEKMFLNVVHSQNFFSIRLERENIFGRHISAERSVVS